MATDARRSTLTLLTRMNVELPVEISEELAGFLEVPEHPEISQGYAEIYQGVWTNPQGEKVEVALKELKLISRMVRGSDQEAVQQSIDTVGRLNYPCKI